MGVRAVERAAGLCLLAVVGGCDAPSSGSDVDWAPAGSPAVSRGGSAPAPVEVSVGLPSPQRPSYSLVVADWTMGKDLSLMIAEQRKRAEARDQTLYVELTASWCTSCKALHAAMADPRMQAAFAGAYVLRIDVDELGQQAVAAGYDSKDIPAFYEVGPDGRASGRMIDGGAWSESVPEQMAVALSAFFASGTS